MVSIEGKICWRWSRVTLVDRDLSSKVTLKREGGKGFIGGCLLLRF